MLAVTPMASQAIRQLVSSGNPTGEGGLRISSAENSAGVFSLRVAVAPDADDWVVTAEDAELFLEPRAAVALDDKILDAAVNPEGTVAFKVKRQRRR